MVAAGKQKWRDLGRELIPDGDTALGVIEVNANGSVTTCCDEMFKTWLQRQPKASWEQLIEGLNSKSVMLGHLAAQIEGMLEPSVASASSHTTTATVSQTQKGTTLISKEEFESYQNDVGSAFIALQAKMRALLKDANCDDLRNACITQQHNPRGAELSRELKDKIFAIERSDKLFDLLVDSPYWSWIDIRILEAMVTASHNPQARELLGNYKAVVFSKRLLDLLPNVPSKEVKEKYYEKVVAKMKGHDEVTVANLLEFQSYLEAVIMVIKKGTCILKHLKKGCVEGHWYIPTSCVDKAYKNARAKHHQFSECHLQLQSLKIGHNPTIHYPPFDSHLGKNDK